MPSQPPDTPPWRHAIPPARDRLQSRIFAWILGPILAVLCSQSAIFALSRSRPLRVLFAEAFVISAFFALAVWKLRAATGPAALAGGAICLLVTFYTASPRLNPLHSGLAPLIELFILTFAATRAGRLRKQRAGLAEPRRGRSTAQILANLGAAGLVTSAFGAYFVGALNSLTHRFLFIPIALPVLLLASLTEATADTVSSEFGQAFGGQPILFTTLRPVPPGTDGAVTLKGTLAGIVTATLVAAIAPWALRLPLRETLIALLSGIAGLFFDSLLGATIERRGWLGNDLVNFISTLFAAGLAVAILLVLSPHPNGSQWFAMP